MTDPVLSPTSPSVDHLLHRAIVVWRKAQIVYESPSWEGQPEPRSIAEALADRPECEDALFELLLHPNQLVAAYSLITLELMNSGKFAELPAALLADSSNITLMLGSVKNGLDLGGLARQIQKRAKARTAQ